jgi:hypothetical protein
MYTGSFNTQGCTLRKEDPGTVLDWKPFWLGRNDVVYSYTFGAWLELGKEKVEVWNLEKRRIWSYLPTQRSMFHITFLYTLMTILLCFIDFA